MDLGLILLCFRIYWFIVSDKGCRFKRFAIQDKSGLLALNRVFRRAAKGMKNRFGNAGVVGITRRQG